jgi:hypothetical protein
MSELTIREPSEKLKKKLDEVTTNLVNATSLVNEVFTLGREEGFSDNEIGQMVRDRLAELGYNPRSIRRVLPSSAKDLTKARKDNLVRDQDNSDGRPDEDIMSSSESHITLDENQLDTSSNTTNNLQIKIKTLEEQLTQERIKNEDLTIQIKNANIINLEWRGQLGAVRNATSILVITKDNFPPDSSLVFSSEDHMFVLKFKGTKVLDISVVAQKDTESVIFSRDPGK